MLPENVYNDTIPMVPPITLDDVPSLVFEEYGLHVENCRQLRSYSDKNFLVTARGTSSSSERYVLKVINGMQSKRPRYMGAQNELLLHLSEKGINCPLPVKNGKGELNLFIGLPMKGDVCGVYITRLFTYVPGVDMYEARADPTPDLLRQVGVMLGNVCNATESFAHPGYVEHSSVFDPASLPSLRKYVSLIEDNNERVLIASAVDEYLENVVPQLKYLKQCPIHGDLGPENIVLTETASGYEVTGIIDIFDTMISYTVFEMAICLGLVYQMYVTETQENLLEITRHLFRGYRSVRNLSELESRLLKSCTEACIARVVLCGLFMVANGKCDPETAKKTMDCSALRKLREMSSTQFLSSVSSD